LIDAEEARQLVYRNRITRALGQKPTVVVDYFVHTWQASDVMVLCTDGLTGQVSDAEIAAVVSRCSPDEAATRLVELANERGGPDNISVIVVRAEPDALDMQAAPPRASAERWEEMDSTVAIRVRRAGGGHARGAVGTCSPHPLTLNRRTCPRLRRWCSDQAIGCGRAARRLGA